MNKYETMIPICALAVQWSRRVNMIHGIGLNWSYLWGGLICEVVLFVRLLNIENLTLVYCCEIMVWFWGGRKVKVLLSHSVGKMDYSRTCLARPLFPQRNVVSQDRWFFTAGSVALNMLKLETLCQEYVVLPDRSLFTVVSQDRFHCIY